MRLQPPSLEYLKIKFVFTLSRGSVLYVLKIAHTVQFNSQETRDVFRLKVSSRIWPIIVRSPFSIITYTAKCIGENPSMPSTHQQQIIERRKNSTLFAARPSPSGINVSSSLATTKTHLHWIVFSRRSAACWAARLSICCSGGSHCCSRCSAGTCGIRSGATRSPRRRFLQSHLRLLRFERKRLWTKNGECQWRLLEPISQSRSSGNWTDRRRPRHKSLGLRGKAGQVWTWVFSQIKKNRRCNTKKAQSFAALVLSLPANIYLFCGSWHKSIFLFGK